LSKNGHNTLLIREQNSHIYATNDKIWYGAKFIFPEFETMATHRLDGAVVRGGLQVTTAMYRG